jgi:hypothetical protein
MNSRTSQTQRKVRLPNVLRRKPKKAVAEEIKQEAAVKADDLSCQTRGCGCGN